MLRTLTVDRTICSSRQRPRLTEEQRKVLRMRLFTFDCCEERMRMHWTNAVPVKLQHCSGHRYALLTATLMQANGLTWKRIDRPWPAVRSLFCLLSKDYAQQLLLLSSVSGCTRRTVASVLAVSD
jgi:hypothetical protein